MHPICKTLLRPHAGYPTFVEKHTQRELHELIYDH